MSEKEPQRRTRRHGWIKSRKLIPNRHPHFDDDPYLASYGKEDMDGYISDEGSTIADALEMVTLDTSVESEYGMKQQDLKPEDDRSFFFTLSEIKKQLLHRLHLHGCPKDLWEATHSQDSNRVKEHLCNVGNQENGHIQKEVALLAASATGCLDIVKTLIDNNTSTTARDCKGRTALHLAASAGNIECVKLLLKEGAAVNEWDNLGESTPLICAAHVGSAPCIGALLEAGADIDAGINRPQAQTALLWAVRVNSAECVDILLKHGAQINSVIIFSENPIHVAAAEGFTDVLRLLLQYNVNIDLAKGPNKMTALHMAAEDGSVDCLELLLDAKANVHVVTHRLRTALHLAALAQSADCVSLLLRAEANPNAEDCDKRTPLHNAIVKGYGNLECVKILLEYGADPNRQDCYGYTPLHLAALNEYSSSVKLLMDKGADITLKTKGGATALSFIIRKTPSMVECISEIFDRAITLNDDNNDRDMEVKMDYRVLVPHGKTESYLLITLIAEGQKHFLKHPLCESFLHQKWERVRKFFFFNLSGYTLFVIMLTIYTLNVFRNPCLKPNGPCAGNHTKESNASGCFEYVANLPTLGYVVNLPLRYEWHALLMLTFIMVAKEIIELWLYAKMYFLHVENWIQWSVIAHVFILMDLDAKSKCIIQWQYHVAAVGILMAWSEVMFMIGRLPEFGLYVEMFTNVSKEFGKFLLAYVWFIIAFSFSFSITFCDMDSFYESIPYGIIKTLVMMTGEFEYEELFKHKTLPGPYSDYPGTTELIFFFFILFGTVVLMNLLVGMAVNDISGLQKTARLERLVRQTELIGHIESTVFCPLINWLPLKLRYWIQNGASLVPSAYRWSIYIRPNDPRDTRIPRDIIDLASKIARTRMRRPSGNKRRFVRTVSTNSWMQEANSEGRNTAILEKVDEGIINLTTDTSYIHSTMVYLSKKVDRIEESMSIIEKQLEKIVDNIEKNVNEDITEHEKQ